MSKTNSAGEAVERWEWYTGKYNTFENKTKMTNL